MTVKSGAAIFTLQTSDAENDPLVYTCNVTDSFVPLQCLSGKRIYFYFIVQFLGLINRFSLLCICTFLFLFNQEHFFLYKNIFDLFFVCLQMVSYQ
jgi:hypothetical protein